MEARIELNEGERARLERLVANGNTAQKHVRRARIVLLTAEGLSNAEAARQSHTSLPTVRRWQKRFRAKGVDGLLKDATRPPGTPPVPPETVERVVELTLQKPLGEATHWTGRAMARRIGISLRSVQRIWRAHRLKPHLVRRFKLSSDPNFAEKVQDVVGLYVDPPQHALVLSVDEKSQIQALEQTQPGLPVAPGHRATQTHDYERHGTTTLFAALNILDGRIVGQCALRHRHQEFIRFLNRLERTTPRHLDLHLIVDNYAPHKHPKVRAWLERHARFRFHFTPTSASWLNAVEGFFAKLTRQRLRRGSFVGLVDLQAAIHRFIAEHNESAKPFVWTADPHAIIDKVRRAKLKQASTPGDQRLDPS
jgi:transposase